MATKTKSAVAKAGLDDDALKRVLYLLKLCRYFDERMEALYRQGRLPGAIYSGRGQEGTQVGVAFALRPDDSLFPTHRDLNAQFAKGVDLKRVMAQYWGRVDGYTRGRDGNSHMGDWAGARTFAVLSNLPSAYPPAAGAALAYKKRGEDRVAMAICGDGATSNGRWHECLNVSAIWELPVIWVVNNNQFAYSTPNKLEFPVPTIAERDAVERARGGDGPSLVESVSLRWRGHAGHDPAKYVPKEMLDEYMEFKDPVKRFQELLTKEGVVDEAAVAELNDRIKKEFDEGYEFAQQSPLPEPADVTAGVFADDGYWQREAGRGGGTP